MRVSRVSSARYCTYLKVINGAMKRVSKEIAKSTSNQSPRAKYKVAFQPFPAPDTRFLRLTASLLAWFVFAQLIQYQNIHMTIGRTHDHTAQYRSF